MMLQFLDAHRDAYGVERICAVLPIAPAVYYEHKARERDADRQPPRVRHDVGCARRSVASGGTTARSTASARCGTSSRAR
jgi:hypothetical protein